MTARALLALAAAGLALAAAGADFTIAALFEALAKPGPQRATFQEERHLALLDRPLRSAGELAFTPPARLEKRTLTPQPERLVVDGERITLERGGRTLAMGLRDHPTVAVLIESIRSILAGDLAGVTRTYSVALDGTRARWRLLLRPLDPAAATLVERIEISGSGAEVQTIATFHADGDRTVLRITPVKP